MATSDPSYLHGHHESVLRSHRWRTAENSCGYLLGELEPGLDLLDVGCGPGTVTSDLARRVAPGRVVGIDSATAVLEEAGRVATEPAVDLCAADVMALPYDEAAFDVVHAHQVLQHLPDPVGALAEMGRVCRPDGLVAARDGDYGAMTWFPPNANLEHWLETYRRVARTLGGEPDAGRHLLSWAQAAGFLDVTPSASLWCYATPEERAWWGGLWADRVVGSRFASVALESGAASRSELERMADGWRWWAAQPSGWFVVIHGEVLCRPGRPAR